MQAISAPWWMASRLMCRMHLLPWGDPPTGLPSARSAAPTPASSRARTPEIQLAYASSTWLQCRLRRRWCCRSGSRPAARRSGDGWASQHADDDVREPPRDGCERLGLRLRIGEVDAAVGVHGPAVRHRCAEVLLVGQALEAGAELVRPVVVELIDQLGGEAVGGDGTASSI